VVVVFGFVASFPFLGFVLFRLFCLYLLFSFIRCFDCFLWFCLLFLFVCLLMMLRKVYRTKLFDLTKVIIFSGKREFHFFFSVFDRLKLFDLAKSRIVLICFFFVSID
jgi:hypothetical protein